MSEGVLIAIIGALALIAVALIGAIPLLMNIRKHARIGAGSAAAAADQLVNNHDSNWRDNADKNQAELMRVLRAHGRRLGTIEKRLAVVEEDTLPG